MNPATKSYLQAVRVQYRTASPGVTLFAGPVSSFVANNDDQEIIAAAYLLRAKVDQMLGRPMNPDDFELEQKKAGGV